MSFDSLKFSTSSNLDQVEKFSEWILDFYTFESSRRKHSQLHFCECACVRLSRSYSRVIRTISVCHEITIAQCHIIATSHVCVCVFEWIYYFWWNLLLLGSLTSLIPRRRIISQMSLLFHVYCCVCAMCAVCD